MPRTAFISVRRCAMYADDVITLLLPSMNARKAYQRYIWMSTSATFSWRKKLLKMIDHNHMFEASQIANDLALTSMRMLEARYEAAKLQLAALERSMRRKP